MRLRKFQLGCIRYGPKVGFGLRLFREADACFYLWAYDFGLGMFAGWIEGNWGMWIWA